MANKKNIIIFYMVTKNNIENNTNIKNIKNNTNINNIKINIVKINKNSLSNNEKVVYDYIKLPEDKYKFYDEFLPNNLKKYFKEPIGVYDPYGNNMNPLTNEPYKNLYKNKINEFKGGPLVGHKFNETYMNWAYIWSNLPLFKIVGNIINSIRNNTITIIKAGTGVGKSFLGGRICSQAFNFQKKVLMTLPKKLLARKTATDTAITCDVVVGEEVGYYFKGEYMLDKNNKNTKIIFTTTGSLIRKLTGDDPYLKEYSAIIIDEAHERSVQTDELILFLKKALLVRDDLKIIFISATLDLEKFQNYFKDYSFGTVDLGESTTYPIEDIWEKEKVKDWQVAASETVLSIIKKEEPGDILVFVKSGGDFGKIKQYIEQGLKKINSRENPFMTVLDASVKGDDQEYAIDEFKYRNHPTANPNRPFTRKIVFATNVAESSLTVSGIVFVIDSGLALEDFYDPKRSASALFEKFVSQSAIKQRRGRAGRVQPGVCYHLYTEKDFNNFIKFPVPSIEKSDLTMDILDIMKIPYIKNFGDVDNLLNDMMSPPLPIFIKNAQNTLYSMEAINSLDKTATITDLGQAIAKFSGIPIQYARSIIASYYYHCKYDVIPIIVILGMLKGRIKDIYLDYKPKTKLNNVQYKKMATSYKKKQHQFDSKYGDFMTLHNIYVKFREFMKLPKEYVVEEKNKVNQNGGDINNNNSNNTSTVIDIQQLTKKTWKDAMGWCIENGISHRVFVKKDNKDWDKVGNESRKIDRTLMNIVQPPELRFKNFKEYKNNGGKAEIKVIKKEIKDNILNSKNIDPESKIILGDDIDKDEVLNGNVDKSTMSKINSMLNEIKKKVGGYRERTYDNYIQSGGYNNKKYEINFFPNIKLLKTKEDNIMVSLAHGLYINIAKKLSSGKYESCFPIEKSLCRPDQDTTVALSTKPSFLFYGELFMLREEQRELKLNFVNKFTTEINDVIKDRYKKYIEDCYKKNSGRTNYNKLNSTKKYKHKDHKSYKGKSKKSQKYRK